MSTNDRVFGSTDSTSTGIGRISPSLKNFAYFSTLSLSQSLAVFLLVHCDDQETGGFGADGMVLVELVDK